MIEYLGSENLRHLDLTNDETKARRYVLVRPFARQRPELGKFSLSVDHYQSIYVGMVHPETLILT